MTRTFLKSAALCSLCLLAACQTIDSNGPRTDMRIKVVTSPDGTSSVAIPPNCPDFADVQTGSPWDNKNAPTFGCATQANLAAQVANPEDLTDPRDLGAPDPVTDSAAFARYRAGKTILLIYPANDKQIKREREEDKRLGGGAMEEE